MKIPKQIFPDPILSSVIEIRFDKPLLEKKEIVSIFATALSKKYPYFSIRNINTYANNNNEKIRHKPIFNFSNENYLISLGVDCISFENVSSYNLWRNHFEEFKRVLNKKEFNKFYNVIERIGLRYVNIFEHQVKLEDTTNIKFSFLGNDVKLMGTTARTYFCYKNANFNLSVGENVTVNKTDDNFQKTGLYVDIDVHKKITNTKINSYIFKELDNLHKLEKEFLFTKLMREDFFKKHQYTIK